MATCDTRFFLCRNCGNLTGVIHSSGVPLVCCGEKMTEMVPGSADASTEKHVPAVTVSGGAVKVSVGSAPHPMTGAHFIEWVYLQTERGGQRKCLRPGEAPEVRFTLDGDRAVAAFAYCNLHGLWKTDL